MCYHIINSNIFNIIYINILLVVILLIVHVFIASIFYLLHLTFFTKTKSSVFSLYTF